MWYNKYMKKKINKNYIVLGTIFAVTCVLLAVFEVLVLNRHIFWLDKFNIFVANHRTDWCTKFFKIFTHLGSFITLSILVVVAVVLLWFVAKKKRMSVFYLVCFGAVAVSNFIIKRIIKRPRPVHLMIIKETGFSFPSGHSMMSFVFFVLLIHFVYKCIKNKWAKWLIISASTVMIAAIGFSRIYLGVHYLTDVIGGWLISLAIICVFIFLYNTKIIPRLKDESKTNH